MDYYAAKILYKLPLLAHGRHFASLKPATGQPLIFLRPQQTVGNTQTKYARVTTTEKSCACDWFPTIEITSYKFKLFYSCDCKKFFSGGDCFQIVLKSLTSPLYSLCCLDYINGLNISFTGRRQCNGYCSLLESPCWIPTNYTKCLTEWQHQNCF